jgi:hypothetical protein
VINAVKCDCDEDANLDCLLGYQDDFSNTFQKERGPVISPSASRGCVDKAAQRGISSAPRFSGLAARNHMR